jgi:hypothetical protein
MERWASTTVWRVVLIAALGFTLFALAQVVMGGNIDNDDKWAWSTNVGWINFAPICDGCERVSVYADHLEGYAWGENVGWIRLGTHAGGGAHTYGNTSANDYGVNRDGTGELSGYAWGTNVGWIQFDPTGGGVSVDRSTGSFDGYAWGENVGWIHFKNSDPPYNVVATNDPPVAADDSASTPEKILVAIDVAANDSDPDGNLDTATANSACAYGSTGCAGADHGSLTDNGDGTIAYTPDPDHSGPDSFVYEICDSGAPSLCDTASVAITVTPVSNRLYLPLALRTYPPPPPPTPEPSSSVTNGGFETGDFAGWTTGGYYSRTVETFEPYEGTHTALLGEVVPLGYHLAASAWMMQQVAVPSGTGPITLSFWYRIFTRDRDEDACFRMVLKNSNGQNPVELLRDGYDAIIPPTQLADLGWKHRTRDLSDYRGQTVQLWFQNQIVTEGAQGTWTYVDAVNLH